MANKLIVVIDAQNDFVSGSLGSLWAEGVSEKIADYLKSTKDEVWKIYFTRDTHHGEGCNPLQGQVPYSSTLEGQKLPVLHCVYETDGWQIADNVWNAVKDLGDKKIGIWNKSTFMSKHLGHHMEYNSGHLKISNRDCFDEIEIMGFCTSICVISNALFFRGLFPNMKITIREDLCADIDAESHVGACRVMKNCQLDVDVPEIEDVKRRIREYDRNIQYKSVGVEIEFINMLKSNKFNFHSGVEINGSTTFKELGFDSLDEVEFVMALEEKFAIAITDEEVINCRTVGQVIELIKTKVT